MKTHCYIAGAGDYIGSYIPGNDDYIIAADDGFSHLIERNIRPDMVVGDFDSLGEIPNHPNVLRTPTQKDDTDMMTAVKEDILLVIWEGNLDDISL